MTRRTPSPALFALVLVPLLALGAAAPAPSPQVGTPLLPDTVVETPGRPRMILLTAPGSSVVALRLSVPVEEAPAEAGAAKLLVRLGVARARAQAGPVGAEVRGERTPAGIAYTVVGPTADLDYLAYLLRLAVAEPLPPDIDFRRIRSDLLEEVRRSGETASGRITRDLRARLDPGTPPAEGTVGSLEAVTPGMVLDLWRRTHRSSDMDLIVAGDVVTEVLFVSFQDLGARLDAGASPPSGSAPDGGRVGTQVLRHWYGEARVLGDSGNPRAAVAALLVADVLRGVELGDRSGFEAAVQLWDLEGQKALAVIGAAYARSADAMRDRVRGVLAAAREAATPAVVESTIARLRGDLLIEARTPGGRVDLVGRHLGASGAPDAAHRYLEELDDVTSADLRAFLDRAMTVTPVRAEVGP